MLKIILDQVINKITQNECIEQCETTAGARFSKVPVTLQARNQIFKSKYKE